MNAMKFPIANFRLPIEPKARRDRCFSTGHRPLAPAKPPAQPGAAILNHSAIARRGFTLVEIMVSVMIFSMVIAAIYATWALIMRATEVGENSAAQAQRQRVVMRAIGDALMGVQSFQASQNYYWFKLANGNEPFLSFVARLPDTFPRHNKFVGGDGGPDASARRVTFSLAQGANGGKDLILRQNRILMDLDQDENQYPLVLARNVKLFAIEWWGTNQVDNRLEWSTEWADTQTNTIPQMLRVHLVMGANTERGKEAPDFAATRIYTVPSQMMPVVVQGGAGVPPGGPGGPGGPGANNGLLNNLINGAKK